MVNRALIPGRYPRHMDFERIAALPRQSRSAFNSLLARHSAEVEGRPLARTLAGLHAISGLWRARAEIVAFLRTGDEAVAVDLRRRFGLAAELDFAPRIPATLFSRGSVALSPQRATVVVPIFDAAQMVERLLAHLPSTLSPDQPVLLIDDGSTDTRISSLIERFQRVWPHTDILVHTSNRGFVATANAAFARLARGDHAILLNSDTLPPKGWVPRLLAPFAEAPDIASVTPFSNNAEILSVPRAGIEGAPDIAMIDRMDNVARQFGQRRIALPTGVGFCIALNRRYLDRIGGFDPAFGRGYGEEVDWCRKAMNHGGRHVVATNLVVGHTGSASFGASARKANVARAARVIAARHPAYPSETLDWQRRDPAAPERLALALAWAAHVTQGDIPVFIGHALGGGAETALQRETDGLLAIGAPCVVVLRVGGPAAWRLELRGQRFVSAGDIDDTALLFKLLEPLERRHVIYSCGVGAADPAALPETLERLAEGHRLSLRIHDFFPISPSWNLIGSDDRYAGVPPLDTTDPAHHVAAVGDTGGMPHRGWRAAWARLVVEAQEITVFAPSGQALIEAAYPQARGKTVIRPHDLKDLPPPLPAGGRAIGVLGGINLAKGGAVLERLSALTDRRIVVIGEMDGRFRLPPPHHVHGRFKRREIARLARHYDIGVWFLPSIWPETFSFAMHEALATGLPVVGFDLGAQGETLTRAENGHALALDPEETDVIRKKLEMCFAG